MAKILEHDGFLRTDCRRREIVVEGIWSRGSNDLQSAEGSV